MWLYFKTFSLGLASLLVSLTAPFMVPVALLCTKREARTLAWAWYDTPDEPELYDMFIPAVHRIYRLFGHWVAAWYWFGWRNRAHGFTAKMAIPWPRDHVDPGRMGWWAGEGLFMYRKQLGPLQFIFGWQAYRSGQFDTGFEARPVLSIKGRPALASQP